MNKTIDIGGKCTRLTALELRGARMTCPHCGKEIKVNFKVAEIEFVKEGGDNK